MRLTNLLLLMILLSNITQAQTTEFISTNNIQKSGSVSDGFPKLCTFEHYLPDNKPRTANAIIIAKDSSGRFWFADKIGNPTGISVYDGSKWLYYDASNSPVANQIYSIIVDSKGIVWIAHSRGVVSFKNNAWTTYSNILSGVSTIIEDKFGKIWCIPDNNNRINIYNGSTWETKDIPDYTGGAWNSTLDSEKNIWFTSYKGVYKYDYNTFKRYTKDDGLIDISFFFDLKAIGNDVYCLTNFGINKFNGITWDKFETPGNISTFSQIFVDKESKIWLLSRFANSIYRKDEDSWTEFYLNIGNILQIYVDTDNTFWLTNHKQEFYSYKNNEIKKISNNSETSISFIDMNSILKDKRGNLWVSYNNNYIDKGFGKYDGQKWTLYPNYWGNICFYEDKLKNVYISTSQALLKYDGVDLKDITVESKIPYGISGAFFIDSKQKIWYKSGSNICTWDGTTHKEYSEFEGIKNMDVIKITEDKKGNIWAVYKSSTYLSMFNGSLWRTFEMTDNYNQSVFFNDVEADSLDNVWIATSAGLRKFENDKIIEVPVSPLNYINDIAIDSLNNLWMCNEFSNKIYVYKDGYYKSYSPVKDPVQFYPKYINVDNEGNVYCGSNIYGAVKLSYGLKSQVYSKTDVTCTGASNGSLILVPNSSCSYSIDGGINYQKSSTFTNLTKGNYRIVVKSESGCISDTTLALISQPTGIFDVEKTDISCNGNNNGTIKLITSGLDNITYLWNNGETGNSISNLSAGSYNVSVSHSNNCEFVRNFEILEPDIFNTKSVFTNLCGTSKGTIELSIEGGTKPYSVSWSNGETSSTLTNLSAGSYNVSVTDKNNCNTWHKTFEIKSVDNSINLNPITKYKEYLCSDNIILSALPESSYYQWKDNNSLIIGNSNSITVEKEGLYYLKVLNENNCFVKDSIRVFKRSTPEIPQICMVTVDENSKNKIIWNKINIDSAVNILIYKETNMQGIFEKIGTVPAYRSGNFIDDNSDSRVKTEKYLIKAQDQCGVETNSGIQHKTIHLSANRGTNGEVNLAWNNYEGMTYGTYNLYRGSSKTNMSFLSSVSSNNNSYSDMNPPSGGLFYQVEILLPYNCNPDAFKTTYSSVRSNFIDNGLTPVSQIENSEKLVIGPNPAGDEVNVEFENNASKECTVTMTTIFGRIVYQSVTHDSVVKINRGNIPSGVYIIIVKGTELLKSKVVFK